MASAQVFASGEEPGLGAGNLLDEARSLVWRAPSSSEAWVDVDLGEALPINAVAVVNHNLSYEGSFEIAAGDSQGSADALNISLEAWEPLWGVDECGADEHGADGYLSSEERERYFPAGSLRLVYLDELIVARWVRIRFLGPTWADQFNPDGKIQCGVLVVGYALESARLPSGPLPLGPQDSSRLAYSEGGQCFRDPGPAYRMGRYQFQFVRGEQVAGGWYDLLQEVGVGKSFVADFFPDAPSQVLRIRNQIYGHLTKLAPIKLTRGIWGGVVLDIRESW
jgi:hypothetical protein